MSKRLRVLIVIPVLNTGGAEWMAVHLISGLDRTRFDVGVISLFDSVGSRLEAVVKSAGARLWFLGKKPGFDARMFARIDRVIRIFRPGVIHTHLRCLWYALPALWPRPIAAVHTVHGMADRNTNHVSRMLNRIAFRARVVPVSIAAQVSASLRRAYGVTGAPVIPNGIPVREFLSARARRDEWRVREGFRETDVLFTCAAGLRPIKNHAMVLESFASGPAQDPRSHLLFAGGAVLAEEIELLRELQHTAKRLGIESRVHFLGNRNDMEPLYGASDVFVLASRSEANPLCVMEAMASGLPVVATAVGGVPELVEDGVSGMLVPSGDCGSMAATMLTLLRNDGVRRGMGAASARIAAERFDVSLMVNAYSTLYETVTHNARTVSSSF